MRGIQRRETARGSFSAEIGRDRLIIERGERGTRSRVGALITADSRRGADGAIGERNRLIMPRQSAGAPGVPPTELLC